MACVADTFRGHATFAILAAQSRILSAGRYSMQMHLLTTSHPIIQAGRAANYRSCTLEPWVDVELGRGNGNASPKRMTSDLEKKKNTRSALIGVGRSGCSCRGFCGCSQPFRGRSWMLTRIWILFLPATLEQTHCADVIGGPSGLGDGHILPDWGSLGRE